MAARSIRKQVIWATGTVITIVLAATVAITLALARRELYALGTHHAVEQAEAIAARSQFALIAGRGAPSVAESLLGEVVWHNEVLSAALIGNAGTLSALEVRKGLLARCPRVQPTATVTRVHRLGGF